MGKPQPRLEFTTVEGSLWRHDKSGDVYVVTGNGFLEATLEQAVFYKKVDTLDAVTWARSAKEFRDGRFSQFRETTPTHLKPD